MKKEIISNQIRILSEMITEQQAAVLSYEGKIPQIEMDILLGNIRKLYEALLELNKTEVPTAHAEPAAPAQHDLQKPVPSALLKPVAEPVAAPVAVAAEPVTTHVQPPMPEPVAEPVAVAAEPETTNIHIQPEVMLASVETPVQEPVREIVSEEVMPQSAVSKEKISEPLRTTGKTASLFDDTPTIADKFTGAPSLYDKFASSGNDKSLATKLQNNPVTDLKKSIGINDKFALINELFDGDMNAYSESIDRLNSSSGIDDAMQYLEQTLAPKYGWDGSGDAYLKLHALLARRFAS